MAAVATVAAVATSMLWPRRWRWRGCSECGGSGGGGGRGGAVGGGGKGKRQGRRRRRRRRQRRSSDGGTAAAACGTCGGLSVAARGSWIVAPEAVAVGGWCQVDGCACARVWSGWRGGSSTGEDGVQAGCQRLSMDGQRPGAARREQHWVGASSVAARTFATERTGGGRGARAETTCSVA